VTNRFNNFIAFKPNGGGNNNNNVNRRVAGSDLKPAVAMAGDETTTKDKKGKYGAG